MTASEARAELVRLLDEQAEPFPYDRAAFLLAVDEFPGLEIAPYEARLQGYADRVRERLPGAEEGPRARITALRRILFEEEGFHGNRGAYYDYRNSYLNEVLDRKLGIPISLATLVLGVTRRLGWPVVPVNFPAHFLLRYADAGESLAVDAFDGALILGEDELAERWRLSTGSDAPDLEAMLVPAEPRAVLLRMLNNLLGVHLQAQRLEQAALAVEKMALIDPGSPAYHQALGRIYARAGRTDRAVRHLEHFLREVPHGAAADEARELLEGLRRGPEAGA